MAGRLIPFKSQEYRYTEATGMALAYGVFGFIGRELEFDLLRAEPPVYGLQIVFALLGTMLSIVASNYWARWRGAELITFAESARRNFQERAEGSTLIYALRFAQYMALFGMVAFLLMFRIPDWPNVIPITAGWFVAGFIAGLYASRAAHVNWRTEQARAAGETIAPVPYRERAYRHYLGYVVGLIIALLAATLLPAGRIAAITAIAGFLAGKLVTDMLRPQPAYNYAALGRMRWWHPFYMIAFGMVWWGLPLAALFLILVHAPESLPPREVEIQAVLIPLMLGALWGFLLSIMSFVVRWGPRAPEPA